MNKSSITSRIKQYEETRNTILSGNFKFVPFFGFNRLQRYVPGIMPRTMYKVTSHMGVGKTQLAKYLFVYQTMVYAIKNNINFKVIYFALEESKEEFLDGLFIHLLKRMSKIQLNRFTLSGHHAKALTKEELEQIKGIEKIVTNIAYHIEIVDNKYRPTDMFNTCKYYASKWGTFAKDKEGAIINDSYTPRDKNQIVLVVADHISLLESEFDEKTSNYLSDHKTIAKWHTNYCRKIITKAWGWSVLNVQQQSLESERQQFTNKGDTVINKILPTLDGLANNKEVARDDYVVLGMFAPERYHIENYLGYDIKKDVPEAFGDRFRSLHLLKNRFGHPNKILPLYFDGRYTHFKELPASDDLRIKHFHTLLKT